MAGRGDLFLKMVWILPIWLDTAGKHGVYVWERIIDNAAQNNPAVRIVRHACFDERHVCSGHIHQ